MGGRRRWSFLLMAIRRGYGWLVEVANHVGLWLLLVVFVLGVAITGSVYVALGWKWTAVVLLGLLALVVFEGAYRTWDETDRKVLAQGFAAAAG